MENDFIFSDNVEFAAAIFSALPPASKKEFKALINAYTTTAGAQLFRLNGERIDYEPLPRAKTGNPYEKLAKAEVVNDAIRHAVVHYHKRASGLVRYHGPDNFTEFETIFEQLEECTPIPREVAEPDDALTALRAFISDSDVMESGGYRLLRNDPDFVIRLADMLRYSLYKTVVHLVKTRYDSAQSVE